MLKDLYVMKIDAKQELDNIISEEDIKRFLDLIFIPEGININLMLDVNAAALCPAVDVVNCPYIDGIGVHM